MPSNIHFARAGLEAQLDFGRTSALPDSAVTPNDTQKCLGEKNAARRILEWPEPQQQPRDEKVDQSPTAEQSRRHEGSARRMNQGVSLFDANDAQLLLRDY